MINLTIAFSNINSSLVGDYVIFLLLYCIVLCLLGNQPPYPCVFSLFPSWLALAGLFPGPIVPTMIIYLSIVAKHKKICPTVNNSPPFESSKHQFGNEIERFRNKNKVNSGVIKEQLKIFYRD